MKKGRREGGRGGTGGKSLRSAFMPLNSKANRF